MTYSGVKKCGLRRMGSMDAQIRTGALLSLEAARGCILTIAATIRSVKCSVRDDAVKADLIGLTVAFGHRH
ncbi:MAG: hypothetical protein ABL898_04070 [Hyphomicrobiaceae bacterium]